MSLQKHVIDERHFIYQDDCFHKLGTDTVRLSQFANKRKGSYICDLGAGQGALSLLMLIEEPTLKIQGIEIEAAAAQIAKLNMDENGFSANFAMDIGDMRTVYEHYRGRFDEVVSNPPYFKTGAGESHKTISRQTARSELFCTPEQLCEVASAILKWGGNFSVVYRSERLCDMICAMRSYRLEPKLIRFIQTSQKIGPKIVLISAKKGASASVKIMPPIQLDTE